MKVFEITFSPTGGTNNVSHIIANSFHQETEIVDLTDPGKDFSKITICKEDLCILAVPAYGGRVPQTAVSRLSQINGNGAKAILIAVYGNREFDDTLAELQEVALAAGFQPVAGIGAVAEHSLVRRFGAGRPDAQDKLELEDFAARITSAIQKQENAPLHLPGNQPYKTYSGSAAKPAAGELCVSCGLCAAKCPVSAIPAQNPRQTDHTSCISCMRCINICPMHARTLDDAVINAITDRLSAVCKERKPNCLYL